MTDDLTPILAFFGICGLPAARRAELERLLADYERSRRETFAREVSVGDRVLYRVGPADYVDKRCMRAIGSLRPGIVVAVFPHEHGTGRTGANLVVFTDGLHNDGFEDVVIHPMSREVVRDEASCHPEQCFVIGRSL